MIRSLVFHSFLVLLGLTFQLSANAADQQSLLIRAGQLGNPPPDLVYGIQQARPVALSHYETWLQWLEREPQKLGQTNYRNEPLIAGSRQNIMVSFRLGVDIGRGGKILVATHWLDGNLLQGVDPRAPNYVSARAEGASLTPVQVLLSGVFSGRPNGRQVPAFEVTGADLRAGDTVNFQIQNIVLPGRVGDLYLPVYFSLGPNQPFFAGSLTALTVRPDRLAQIEVTAPSRLGRNEPATLGVKLADKFGNPVTESLPSLDVVIDGVFSQRFNPTAAVSQLPDIQFSEPGLHSVEIRTGGGSTRGVSNPIMVQSGSRKVLWADLNQHEVLPLSNSGLRENLSRYNLDYRVRAFHGSDLTDSQMTRMDPDAAQIHDGGLRGGGSRLVFGRWQQPTNWSGLPNVLQMALPLIPTDERAVDAENLKLVEMVSGDSVYEWFANRFFAAGYRLGITGSARSLLAPIGPYPRSGLTAILSADGQSPAAALSQRSTYVTTGNKMIVQATVNGAQPGRRIASSQTRSIEGWVQGTAGIERIELVKNGQVIETRNVAGDTSGQTLKVSLRSDSMPYKNQRDLPRNGREWIGFLKTGIVNIDGFTASGFRNPARQAIARNGSARVDFITWTHGSGSSFMVTLDRLVDEEVIELNLREGHEDFDLVPELRAPAFIPASRQMVPLFDLQAGPVERTIKVDGYEDEIRFELVNPEAPDYVEFRFSDISPDETEDYYYIRVHQLDDHKAWTSPVFVGGFDAP